MKLVIELPPREEQWAFNRKRWQEVCADSFLASLPHRFETNAFGYLLMSPPPALKHARYCAEIMLMLRELLSDGASYENVPVSTTDGVKAPDVVWGSTALLHGDGADDLLFEQCPEICVEVLSPSNTQQEMAHKKALYFDAGAQEVWLCEEDGNMCFYAKEDPDDGMAQSALCPEFPKVVTLK